MPFTPLKRRTHFFYYQNCGTRPKYTKTRRRLFSDYFSLSALNWVLFTRNKFVVCFVSIRFMLVVTVLFGKMMAIKYRGRPLELSRRALSAVYVEITWFLPFRCAEKRARCWSSFRLVFTHYIILYEEIHYIVTTAVASRFKSCRYRVWFSTGTDKSWFGVGECSMGPLKQAKY